MRNIIFDFGNVLVQWHPERIYTEYFGDEAKAWWFLRHVVDNDWRGRIDAGEATADCTAELVARYPEYKEPIELFDRRYTDMLTGEVPGMLELLGELIDDTQAYQVYGLTNWSMETFPAARERFGILQMIDRYVVSGAEGLIKPDPRLFQVLMDRYGLRAEECVFIDDNEANVRAAEALGMEGIVFRGAEELRERLGMFRHLTAEETVQLERQGNWADDWTGVRVCGDTDLGVIRHNHLGTGVDIGVVASLTNSHLEHCTIGQGSRVDDVRLLRGYRVGRGCTLSNVGEMSFGKLGETRVDVMNENGGRRIVPMRGMTVGDAYIWARFRDRHKLMQRFQSWAAAMDDGTSAGTIGDGSEIRNATAVIDGQVGPCCRIGHGVIAERFILGENVKLEDGLRLNDTVVGDNSTLARGEVGCSLLFPAHEQHHNSSFLIAALVQGQSNVASGATLGSNHNGRTADGELGAGRGFWPGLCVSLKHNCRFASYTLLAKGDYPAELNITLPFALVNNNVQKNRLEVMPAYWWMYNMYALNRNITKFAQRDRRVQRCQHVEFSPFAPDTAEEMLVARDLLYMWTTKAYQNDGSTEVVAYGMERGHRKTVILKPGEAYKAYEEMLIYYAMETIGEDRSRFDAEEGERVRRWVNIGGQLVQGPDMDRMLDDIEKGVIGSWNDVHKRMDDLWTAYAADKRKHAYGVLCELAQKKALSDSDWQYFVARHTQIKQLVHDRIGASRQKDADNEFRQTTFWNTAEMNEVING